MNVFFRVRFDFNFSGSGRVRAELRRVGSGSGQTLAGRVGRGSDFGGSGRARVKIKTSGRVRVRKVEPAQDSIVYLLVFLVKYIRYSVIIFTIQLCMNIFYLLSE